MHAYVCVRASKLLHVIHATRHVHVHVHVIQQHKPFLTQVHAVGCAMLKSHIQACKLASACARVENVPMIASSAFVFYCTCLLPVLERREERSREKPKERENGKQ